MMQTLLVLLLIASLTVAAAIDIVVSALDENYFACDSNPALFVSNVTDVTSTEPFKLTAAPNFDYSIQKPYNVPESERYSVSGGVYNFLVYDNDKPFQESSNTEPRTEMRIKNDYTSGTHVFQGDIYIPSGTTGVSVFQVFGGTGYATALQLRVNNGSLKRYDCETVATKIYDKWLNIKVEHSVSQHTIKVYVNNVLQLTSHDNGAPSNAPGHYFKCGVYTNANPSHKMESKYQNMHIDSGSDDCQWIGHCKGDKCNTFNDCDGSLTCINGRCG